MTEATFHAPIASKSRGGFYYSFGKRALDVTLVILSSPLTVPLVLFLALLILLTGQNPFYIQKRIGLNGDVFRMWKLRTMLPDAEARLENYLQANPEAREEWNSKQKLVKDPRITTLGRFLRKSSLDELPQLLNVFNGTMSLVGPRPMMISQQLKYTGSAYYHLRPGISGLWQISDRHEGDFTGRVRFDDAYGRNLSFATDFYVLVRTFGVILRGTGC